MINLLNGGGPGGPGGADELDLPRIVDTLLVSDTFMLDLADIVAIHGGKAIMSGGGCVGVDGMSRMLAMNWMLRQAESREDAVRPDDGDEETNDEFI